MLIGLTYDLRDDYRGMGLSEEAPPPLSLLLEAFKAQGVTEKFFESDEPLCEFDEEEPDEAVQSLDETDLAGYPRVADGHVDMGAYEFHLLIVDDNAPADPAPDDPQVGECLLSLAGGLFTASLRRQWWMMARYLKDELPQGICLT